MNTNKHWIKYGVGMVYLQNLKYKVAEEMFNAVLTENPSYGFALAQLGYIRKSEGEKEESLDLFKRAIEYLPEDEIGIYQRGLLHVECNEYDCAASCFYRVLESNSSNIDALLSLGLVFGQRSDFLKADELIKTAYAADEGARDGYARLGWIKAEANDWSGALLLMEKDRQLGRLSPAWLVNLAQMVGREYDWEQAMELVDMAYATNQSLRDGYARLGWIKAEANDWSGALLLMEKDRQLGRLSPAWLVNLAQMVGREYDWEQAMELVDMAYATNQSLRDGYARLGWIKAEANDWSGALLLMEKDRQLGRLSPAWLVNLARVYSHMDDFVIAEGLIEQAYLKNSSLIDAYARLGWVGYLLGKGVSFFHAQIKKDEALDRLSTRGVIFRALYLVAMNSPVEAVREIEPIYLELFKERNWLSYIGWLCVSLGKAERGSELMLRESELGRMDQSWLPSYAVALGICGSTEQALGVLEQVCLSKNEDEVFPIGYKICPDAMLNANQLRQLISGGITYQDLKNHEKPCIFPGSERCQ